MQYKKSVWNKIGGGGIKGSWEGGIWYMANVLRSWQGKLVVGLKVNAKDMNKTPLWMYDGKWKEVPVPKQLKGIYSATVSKDKIYFGTQSNIASIDDQDAFVYELSANGVWTEIDRIGVRFIESLARYATEYFIL